MTDFKLDADPFNVNEWYEKIIREVNETDEKFIFTTIKPFINSVTDMEISKEELIRAINFIRAHRGESCDFCRCFEEQNDGNHIYKDENGQFDIMADTGDSFQWGAIEDIKYCPYCGRRLANDI